MTVKPVNPIDRNVGARVRMQRMLRGLSQADVGKAVGVFFQQVQKYEKGRNRIGASRLQQIANALAPDFFFDGQLSPNANPRLILKSGVLSNTTPWLAPRRRRPPQARASRARASGERLCTYLTTSPTSFEIARLLRARMDSE